MKSCVYLLGVFAVCISYVCAGFTKLAGPYEIEFRRIDHCEDEGTKEFDYHTKMNKINKYEYAYNGECKFPENTNLSVAATSFKKMQSGDWGKAYQYFFSNVCQELKRHFPKLFKKFTEEYMKVAPECPVPAGIYNAENWVAYTKDFPMESLEYGEYKIESILLRGVERVGCILLYVNVEERL